MRLAFPCRRTRRSARRGSMRSAAEVFAEEVGDVVDDEIGPGSAKRIGLSGAVNGDHGAEPGGAAASMPATVVSKAAACSGPTPSSAQAASSVSRCGFAAGVASASSFRRSERRSGRPRPARSSIAVVRRLEETTARRRPASWAASRYQREPSNARTPCSRSRCRSSSFLRFARPCTVSGAGCVVLVALGERDPAAREEPANAVEPRLRVHVLVVVGAAAETREVREVLPRPAEAGG